MTADNVAVLAWLGEGKPPDWTLGPVICAPFSVLGICGLPIAGPPSYRADAWLFWDSALGIPHEATVVALLEERGDVWHAGLKLGLQGQPHVLDSVDPTWMFHADPVPDRPAVSWRLSLRCCLVREHILRRLGGPRPEFRSVDGAGLEMGFRYLTGGAILRHIPALVRRDCPQTARIPMEDEMLWTRFCYGTRWVHRALIPEAVRRPLQTARLLANIGRFRLADNPAANPAEEPPMLTDRSAFEDEISVVLPTRRRYDYLPSCLATLSRQTIRPREVICVDQTPAAQRKPEVYDHCDGLNLHVVWQDQSGQSVARNAALEVATGKWVFFADDDSEYRPDAIERHAAAVASKCAEGSTGLSIPPRAYEVPEAYRFPRLAYNLDTGNALIRRDVVLTAGGFDRNYDFSKGADTDLGMRIYLNGAVVLHTPSAVRIHHKAPGGLRDYGVLWEAGSQGFLAPRPAPTFTYYIMRYFPSRIWLTAVLHSVLFDSLHAVKPERSRPARSQLLGRLALAVPMTPLTLVRVLLSLAKAKAKLTTGPRLLDRTL